MSYNIRKGNSQGINTVNKKETLSENETFNSVKKVKLPKEFIEFGGALRSPSIVLDLSTPNSDVQEEPVSKTIEAGLERLKVQDEKEYDRIIEEIQSVEGYEQIINNYTLSEIDDLTSPIYDSVDDDTAYNIRQIKYIMDEITANIKYTCFL